MPELSALVEEFAVDPGWWDGTGFSSDELEDLIASQASAPVEPPSKFAEFGEDIETEHQCPKCSYRWSGSSTAGAGGEVS